MVGKFYILNLNRTLSCFIDFYHHATDALIFTPTARGDSPPSTSQFAFLPFDASPLKELRPLISTLECLSVSLCCSTTLEKQLKRPRVESLVENRLLGIDLRRQNPIWCLLNEEINECTADFYSEVQPAPALTLWVSSSQNRGGNLYISTVFFVTIVWFEWLFEKLKLWLNQPASCLLILLWL